MDLKAQRPNVYTYGYEDHSSTYVCDAAIASMLIESCLITRETAQLRSGTGRIMKAEV